MIRYLFVVLLAMFTVCSFAQEAGSQTFSHNSWDALLTKHVENLPGNHATQVNYVGFAAEQEQLDSYLTTASQVSRRQFDTWTKAERLAFLINAYNAWTVKLVLNNYERIDSIKDVGGLFQSPWKKSFIPLFGQTVSLDDIEHGFIRGADGYQDYRIHFAVNCASIGCPALRQEAYTAELLELQLNDQTRRFLGDKTRNRIEDGQLKLSSIFKWYAEDFEKGWLGTSQLSDFLEKYADEIALTDDQLAALKEGELDVTYLKYDWNLNDTQS